MIDNSVLSQLAGLPRSFSPWSVLDLYIAHIYIVIYQLLAVTKREQVPKREQGWNCPQILHYQYFPDFTISKFWIDTTLGHYSHWTYLFKGTFVCLQKREIVFVHLFKKMYVCHRRIICFDFKARKLLLHAASLGNICWIMVIIIIVSTECVILFVSSSDFSVLL